MVAICFPGHEVDAICQRCNWHDAFQVQERSPSDFGPSHKCRLHAFRAGQATVWMPMAWDHRLSNVPDHEGQAELQDMQRCVCRWHGTIDFPMCLPTTVRPSCRTCNGVEADAWDHRLSDCLTTTAKLLNMQRCGCRWHGTIDFQMCLTTTAELQEVQRCECRWHGTIDVPICRTKQSGRVAGHARMLMPVA